MGLPLKLLRTLLFLKYGWSTDKLYIQYLFLFLKRNFASQEFCNVHKENNVKHLAGWVSCHAFTKKKRNCFPTVNLFSSGTSICLLFGRTWQPLTQSDDQNSLPLILSYDLNCQPLNHLDDQNCQPLTLTDDQNCQPFYISLDWISYPLSINYLTSDENYDFLNLSSAYHRVSPWKL